MLTLNNIVKVYGEGETEVRALKGVSLNFRESEFIAILGPSGCGKTTMLNIVGGLDRYTDGDLIINGKSTKDFTDRDWDNYRNHSVGFIFQSYNLIPHQSVIKNVELALTLSGVGKEERYERALQALEQVGLKSQAKKMPNQLSGGQMQRVAIARAIVNDPDIILADEPTGALDSETSVQVMDILQELSKTRLVVMVTHNAELADKYATRTINLFDGQVMSDTAPCSLEEAQAEFLKSVQAVDFENNENEKDDTDNQSQTTCRRKEKSSSNKSKKASMSLLTAFSLSLNNLFTKKGRTILTSLAGSIGIVGIALILSLSSGFNAYVQNIQRDTLSNYPITISSTNLNATGAASVMNSFLSSDSRNEKDKYPKDGKVTSHNVIGEMVQQFAGVYESNDLTYFSQYLKDYMADKSNNTDDIISAVNYAYTYSLSVYSENRTQKDDTHKRLYPLSVPKMADIMNSAQNIGEFESTLNSYYSMFVGMLSSQSTFTEMIDNQKLITEQYDLLEGKFATGENEAIIVVDSYNQVSDLALYSMGLMNDDDIKWIFYNMVDTAFPSGRTEEEVEKILDCKRSDVYYNGIDLSELLKLTYKVTVSPDAYTRLTDDEGNPVSYTSVFDGKTANYWRARTSDEINDYLDTNNPLEMKIVGIVRLKKGVSTGCLTGTVCYTPAMTNAVQKRILNSDIVKDYNTAVKLDATQYLDILGNPFKTPDDWDDEEEYVPNESLKEYQKTGTYIGYFDEKKPNSIQIYPTSFEAKDDVIKIIEEYNKTAPEKYRIKYTDYLGIMMKSITTIINAVTYVLIAFVSISLIVSSIMIGIITYISVLERTKEIGVLRSVGASKRDISRVFNAETFIVGATSGVLGILLTLALNIPINIIINSLAGLSNVAVLPVGGAFALIAISIVLTVVAGLIPSAFAAKRDPVVALRSE